MENHILAIDQGTTSTRATIFSQNGELKAQHQISIQQFFPQAGWVEHDPEEIWQSCLSCCREVLRKSSLSSAQIRAMGITNQRETTLLWNRKTGEVIYPAIVWQDRRTADLCDRLKNDIHLNEKINKKTGLLIDPYFSATKIAWILDHVPHARRQAEKGELAFGTIDCFLLWRFTQGAVHATDATNASRTLLFNIFTQSWDEELLTLFNIPKSILPIVLNNADDFGVTEWFDHHPIPITGMVGDQQAAAIGQACLQSGMIKCTYGTGAFIFLNTGKEAVFSQHQLITTLAYRLNQEIYYGLEGSIFMAGAIIQWLRDKLHLIKEASEADQLAQTIQTNDGVYLVPAFTGLGAPYWDPHARAAILGMTRDTGAAHIARAALEAVAYQTRDLMQAICQDFSQEISVLRVDGGMAKSDWFLQFLADILQMRIERPVITETSIFGAALLSGVGAGIYSSLNEVAQLWQSDQSFNAKMPITQSAELYSGWEEAIKKITVRY